MLSGEDQLQAPKFTFHGSRYVQIDGLLEGSNGFDLPAVTAVVVHTDMEQTGRFEYSDPLLNQLHST
jgi:alpha-L-rhamnosidase